MHKNNNKKLKIAGAGVEPATLGYEPNLIPFHYPASSVISMVFNSISFLYIKTVKRHNTYL